MPVTFLTSKIPNDFLKKQMGRRQAVRHKILVLAYGGSNPPAPANTYEDCRRKDLDAGKN